MLGEEIWALYRSLEIFCFKFEEPCLHEARFVHRGINPIFSNDGVIL